MYLFWAIYFTVGILFGMILVRMVEKDDEKSSPGYIDFVFVICVLAWVLILVPAFIITIVQWIKKEKKE